jgi:hypothetical protein
MTMMMRKEYPTQSELIRLADGKMFAHKKGNLTPTTMPHSIPIPTH